MWAKKLSFEGYPARRGQQYSGNKEAPDVICESLCHLHFEVKHVERLNVEKAMDQARRDAGDSTPILAHKRNHTDWLVTMRAEDWFEMLRETI